MGSGKWRWVVGGEVGSGRWRSRWVSVEKGGGEKRIYM